jgi:ubiquinone/menaquinone biosynthesis C-methylase UbiE
MLARVTIDTITTCFNSAGRPEASRLESARKHFDDWAPTYEESFFWRHYFMPLHNMLEERIVAISGSAVLDLGCGTGDMLRRLSRNGGGRLVGVDQSEGMLDVARALSGGFPQIEYVSASAESLPFEDDSFDVATSCIAFHHFPEPLGALQEVRRVLKPRGRLYVCDLTNKGILGKLMLAFGRLKRADDRYLNAISMSRLVRESDLELSGSEHVRTLPPTMLVTAVKKG